MAYSLGKKVWSALGGGEDVVHRREREPPSEVLKFRLWSDLDKDVIGRLMAAKPKKQTGSRYGVAELYGHDFTRLSPEQLRHLATVQHQSQPCPFKGGACNKKRGVCSLRVYETSPENPLEAKPTSDPVVTVCPERFQQAQVVKRWVGGTLLQTDAPLEVAQVNFLEGAAAAEDAEGKPVGRIDTIYARLSGTVLNWCAAEIQAVYFSGNGMDSQFGHFVRWTGPGIPFPDKVRRPDFRSSGPKRLMPQLQVKIPTLRRWGKKMAVVTDRAFFERMGAMLEVPHVSNSDLVWFEVDYESTNAGLVLKQHALHPMTLEDAIKGLVAGSPVSLPEFEQRIRGKLFGPSANTTEPAQIPPD